MPYPHTEGPDAPARPAPTRSFPGTSRRREFLRRGAALVAAGFPALRALAGPHDEPSPAPEVLDFDWVDATRRRPVPVRLYLPGGAGPAPLVVFSHGLGGSRHGYSWLGRHFAQEGIASLHLQHTGSDHQLWRGGFFGMVGRLQGAANETEAIARARDFRFALDTLLSGDVASRLDANRIVAAGHSYGANTSLLVSGAQVERDGRLVDLRDPRVRAAILISAPPFYGEAAQGKVLQPVDVPTLHVTCTRDVIRIPGYYSDASDRIAVFEATGSAHKWLTVYEGGSHSAFTDWSSRYQAMKMATRELAVGFVGAAGDERAEVIGSWRQRHTPLLARFAGPGRSAPG